MTAQRNALAAAGACLFGATKATQFRGKNSIAETTMTALSLNESVRFSGPSMILSLTLEDFKSFSAPATHLYSDGSLFDLNKRGWQPAGNTVRFGGLTLIIGTNASGKSNIRDGLRFIHGISRGYILGDILGVKYGESGTEVWKGIRGGVREIVARNGRSSADRFTIRTSVRLAASGTGRATYAITVDVGSETPTIVHEYLKMSGRRKESFRVKGPTGFGQVQVYVRRPSARKALGPVFNFRSDRPVLTQLTEHPAREAYFDEVKQDCRAFLHTISSMRFLDLDPNSLRLPSIPGQTVLGDKGENLSSVLQAICRDPNTKDALIEWTRELTPLDVVDLSFPTVSLDGKVQLQLAEQGGRRVSAESASDGTLRFLAFAGAVLGSDPARFYFFEEMENGIHPNRAHLLINLLERATETGTTQVVGTTHSPTLLGFLNATALRDAALVYRVGSFSRVHSLSEIEPLGQIPTGMSPGELLSSGWFEDVAAFLEAGDER